MTCDECQAYLQSQLDERRALLATCSVADHLASCEHCRDLYELSESSWTGDLVSPFYKAPEGFAERVLNRAAGERRRRERHWFFIALGIALFLPIVLASTAILTDALHEAPQGPERQVSREPIQAKGKLARLLDQSPRLRELPREGFDYTVHLAGKATEVAAKYVPEWRSLSPAFRDPVAVLQPVRNVGASFADKIAPVAHSAESAYQKLQDWLPKRKTPAKSTPPSPPT